MSLTKEITIDQITITENGSVMVRESTKIIEDGIELSKSYHRYVLTPAQDLTSQPNNVVAICNLTWTPEVIAAYKAQQEANKP
jgi:hypothetical protein